MALEVKICGLTNVDDAKAAMESGADFLGFVMYPGSRRAVDRAVLRRILDRLDAHGMAVAVLVNATRAEADELARDPGVAAIQLHGNETPADFSDLSVPVWRAVHLKDGVWAPDPEPWKADRYLVDAYAEGRYGGTGKPADWPLAAAFAKTRRCMLAGGLDPDNVGEAVSTVRPLGVDASSGVETRPGKKSAEKIVEFIERARSADEEASR